MQTLCFTAASISASLDKEKEVRGQKNRAQVERKQHKERKDTQKGENTHILKKKRVEETVFCHFQHLVIHQVLLVFL